MQKKSDNAEASRIFLGKIIRTQTEEIDEGTKLRAQS